MVECRFLYTVMEGGLWHRGLIAGRRTALVRWINGLRPRHIAIEFDTGDLVIPMSRRQRPTGLVVPFHSILLPDGRRWDAVSRRWRPITGPSYVQHAAHAVNGRLLAGPHVYTLIDRQRLQAGLPTMMRALRGEAARRRG